MQSQIASVSRSRGNYSRKGKKKEEEEEEEKEKEIDEKCTMTNFHERKEELITDFLPLPSSRCFEEDDDDNDDDIT